MGGIACILVSLYLSLVGSLPDQQDFLHATYTIGWSIIIAFTAGFFIMRALPQTTLFSKLTLANVESAEDGFTSAQAFSDLIGKQGIALNNLRPSGKAEINGNRIDVVTEGDYIEKNSPLIVTEVYGSRIVVRENKKS